MSTEKIRSIFEMPWRVRNELRRLLAYPFARLRFALAGVAWGAGWKLYGRPTVQRHRSSSILIGRRLDLRSFRESNPLAPNHPVVLSTRRAGSLIRIGDDFAMTGGVICADTLVEIGDRVNVGANCLIADSDFHPLHAAERIARPNEGRSAAVVIESDVFVGAQCLILKGVRIGHGSVIGAGSVVTRSVPPHSIVAGNPASVIKSLAGAPASELLAMEAVK